MICQEFRADLIEAARGSSGYGAALRHAARCADCAQLLDRQKRLTHLEQRLCRETAPSHLEPELLRFFVAQRGQQKRRRYWRVLGRRAGRLTAAAAAIAAAVLAAVWLHALATAGKAPVAVRTGHRAMPVIRAETPAAAPAAVHVKQRPRGAGPKQDPRAGGIDDLPFVPIPYTEPLGPWERAEVMRMEMPVSALVAAGFPVATMDPWAQASADVLVGEDGRARAVRLISISERSIER